jgi:hypothetical protein
VVAQLRREGPGVNTGGGTLLDIMIIILLVIRL